MREDQEERMNSSIQIKKNLLSSQEKEITRMGKLLNDINAKFILFQRVGDRGFNVRMENLGFSAKYLGFGITYR